MRETFTMLEAMAGSDDDEIARTGRRCLTLLVESGYARAVGGGFELTGKADDDAPDTDTMAAVNRMLHGDDPVMALHARTFELGVESCDHGGLESAPDTRPGSAAEQRELRKRIAALGRELGAMPPGEQARFRHLMIGRLAIGNIGGPATRRWLGKLLLGAFSAKAIEGTREHMEKKAAAMPGGEEREAARDFARAMGELLGRDGGGRIC